MENRVIEKAIEINVSVNKVWRVFYRLRGNQANGRILQHGLENR
ncbi:hypothetical protein [Parapedobacter indicus]|uniref:Uncharacterized protein n=1 Tax=Parapedobacter indicus TaxID=1477437 RepID=A0A1I3DVQ5_9SPHI|nr:hypothetical protein [Parapedobacter indicus]PPL04862.1 hypothetical protein CLV26_101670 [Parapedobacter indicus]SFH90807.1 hypothetical protein SAMN05444682_101656 [Parapedobacter indicus]